MKKTILFSLIILVVFNQSAVGQEPDWLKKMRSITLLSSVRDDALKIFGQPKEELLGYAEEFALPEGDIRVSYSNGKCITQTIEGRRVTSGWQVPAWTITEITFYPKKKYTLKKLGLSVKGFHSYRVYDSPDALIYENDELGIEYGGGVKDKLEYINFYPPSKYDSLYCPQN